ncbi:N-glycosylase/DNA lyase [Paramyrothecium foliicola]|nr:N-glycosylase/DNA lyase [Paramyrothecium foliicola]
MKRIAEWRKLPVSLTELCIDTTLRCGQSFRWRKLNEEWTCTLQGRILSLKQDSTHLHYKSTWPEGLAEKRSPEHDDTEDLLRHYFSLSVDLGTLYTAWSKADSNFQKKAPTFTGVRILNQDAWEALIAFICSSNNNISRISQMVHKLCKHYGPYIGHIGEEALHDFPSPASLTGAQVEAHLRDLGFGYRAKYIAQTAKVIATEKPENWLESLRNPANPSFGVHALPKDRYKTYKEAHEELLSLTGVGPKVADCVCLMGLGWGESVPVDTHVWQIAQRDYKLGKTKTKTFNKAMYDAVGDHFRALWGPYAGWAHSVLFTADLRTFADQAVKQATPVVKVEAEEEGEGTKTIDSDVVIPTKREATVETLVKTEVVIDGSLARVERRSKRIRVNRGS